MKAFILAAGLGTRLKPFTEHCPKALVEVNGKPLLYLLIEKLKRNGYTNLVVNVHHFANQVIAYLEANQNFGINIQISDERDLLLDTGGAILKAQPYLQQDPHFLVHNIDILSNIDFSKIVQNHIQSGALATMAVRDRITDRKFLFNQTMQLRGWQNTKTHEQILLDTSSKHLTPLAFSGIHVMSSDIFKHIRQTGKFSIVETYLDLAKTFNIHAFPHNTDTWIDVGKPEQLQQAQTLIS
ncbi:MAG: nucleotidyltransferase family protein [Bacteroidales bacterium]|jgi:NDP-sugar pyrophosphorylase family protein|nr:nucleotidyltransferase family protein [Bacteroidales bacterium]